MTKIRVKLGPAEAEVEADPEHLREAIDLIPEVAAKLPVAVAQGAEGVRVASTERAQEAAVLHGPGQLPVIALEKGDSLADVIGKFFADPWGRDRRKLSDVREALQSFGMNYPKQSVAVALLRLAKATKIRRFKAEDGEFVYTASAVPLPAVPPLKLEEGVDETASSQNLI
ncbi:MAG: hypothetical protein ABSB56_05680 [Nitrososphaerales archaeon]